MGETLLIATKSCEVYGSDLQMLETVAAMREAGWRVVVTSPAADGPLRSRLEDLGAEYERVAFPVLRRASATPAGMVRLALHALASLPRILRLIRRIGPDVVLVNTIALPLWPLACRLAGRPSACHVHEAEDKDPRLVRQVMNVPIALTDLVIMNSRTTLESMCSVSPGLRARSRVILNGVQPPPHPPSPAEPRESLKLVVIGRLTARKAPDVALEAVARLRRDGHPVDLELVGTPGPGSESFRDGLLRRAQQPDLAGAVTFSGYVSPVWPTLANADIVLAPSLGESFGNAVVEAQLAMRPVVATGVQGHLETVDHEQTGLLVRPGDATACADAVARLIEDPPLARRLAVRAREVAFERFTAGRYRDEVRAAMNVLAARGEVRPAARR